MPRSSKIFRIFVSSTFSDLKHERTVLQRYVFPELQKLCESYGAKFQAIDLRWGVSEEAQFDHKTLEICLNELQRCKELSPRPNFLILLGNRYGWRPLPTEIKNDEFEKILNYFKNFNYDGYKLLQDWYIKDYNRIPTSYCLLPRKGAYLDSGKWKTVETTLRLLFDHVILRLSMQESDLGRYLISATEHEINAGAFQQEDANEHVFAFFRELKNLPLNAKTGDYRDITSEQKPDKLAKEQLDQLKDKIRSSLPKDNIKQYMVDWDEDENDIDTSYLHTFCQDVINQLKPVIESECRTIEEQNIVEVEKIRHQQFGVERARNFTGRETLFSEVEKLLQRKYEPIVIYGESGAGKTAFLAELSNRIISKHKQAVVVQRFIGASVFGTTIEGLLESILIELLPDQEKDIIELTEIDELFQLLTACLKESSAEKPYFLFIDALDHLSDNHHLHKLLTIELPEHVHLVFSTAHNQPVFTLIQAQVVKENLLHIGSLGVNEGKILLEKWLSEDSRTLQANQFNVVMNAFEKCPLPMFLKLAYEETKLWKSYTIDVKISSSIPEIIDQFLNRISNNSNHGGQLVSHVLGFLAASRNGLEETELLELLSATHEVMDDFRRRAKHEYMESHLPPVIWIRLLNDIEPYLLEKKENGSLVYNFYHRHLESRVNDIYLTDEFHRRLSDYFDQKPNFLDEKQTLAHRRKAFELPYQLFMIQETARLEKLLLDIEFIQGKISSFFLQDLLRDYSKLKQLLKEEGHSIEKVNDIEKFCRIRHTLLLQHPNQMKLFALQMPRKSYMFSEAARWYQERGVPYLNSYESPVYEDRLVHAFETGNDESVICRFNPNGEHLLIAGEKVVKIWDIHMGEEVFQFQPKLNRIIDLNIAFDTSLGVVIGENVLKIFDCTSYEVRFQREFKKKILYSALHPKESFVVAGDEEGDVTVINFKNGQEVLIPSDHRTLKKLAWHPTKLLLAIWYSDGSIHLWDATLNKKLKILNSEYEYVTLRTAKIHSLSFDPNSDLLYASQDYGLSIWDIKSGIRINATLSLSTGNHIIKNNLIYSILYNRHLKVWDFDGFSHYDEEHQHFQLHQDADVYRGLLAVLTPGGRILVWDFNELSINQNETKIKMLDESFGWVFTPLYSGFIKSVVPTLMDLIFQSSISKKLSEKMKVSTNIWDENVLSVKMSPQRQFIATGHLGGFLQIKDIKSNIVTRFKPHKTNPILYVDWSYDDSLVFFGTAKRAFVMNTKGKLNMTIKRKVDIDGGIWSPVKNQLLLHDGVSSVELIDFDEKWSQQWSIDVNTNSRSTASWSNSGRYFTISYDNVYFVYEVMRKSNPKLILKGDSVQQVHTIVWMPDDTSITIIDTSYKIILVNLSNNDIFFEFDIIELHERSMHLEYYQQILKMPKSRILSLENQLQQEVRSKTIDQNVRLFPLGLIVQWNEAQNRLAVSYGNWLTIILMDQEYKKVNSYIESGVYGLRWDKDELYVLNGEKIQEERYLLIFSS